MKMNSGAKEVTAAVSVNSAVHLAAERQCWGSREKRWRKEMAITGEEGRKKGNVCDEGDHES